MRRAIERSCLSIIVALALVLPSNALAIDAPTGLTATCSGSINTFSWNAVVGADGYVTYRSVKSSDGVWGPWTSIFNSTATVSWDSPAPSGQLRYKVQAYVGADTADSNYAWCPEPPVIAAAGDVGPPSISAARAATARQVLTYNPRAVLALGDLQYEDGSLNDFLSYYKLDWGQFKSKTWPVPGNHEYHISDAQGYRDYFPGKPFPPYSFDVRTWHILALNSEVEGSQVRWIASDVAAHPSRCALAYFHRPRYSSGTKHGSDTGVAKDLYGALLAGGVDVVLTGHEHNYERFAKQDNASRASPSGIREFVVGTGGALGQYPFGTPLPNSQVRVGPGVAGVLRMNLRVWGYGWNFTDTNGTSRDSGWDTCTNP